MWGGGPRAFPPPPPPRPRTVASRTGATGSALAVEQETLRRRGRRRRRRRRQRTYWGGRGDTHSPRLLVETPAIFFISGCTALPASAFLAMLRFLLLSFFIASAQSPCIHHACLEADGAGAGAVRRRRSGRGIRLPPPPPRTETAVFCHVYIRCYLIISSAHICPGGGAFAAPRAVCWFGGSTKRGNGGGGGLYTPPDGHSRQTSLCPCFRFFSCIQTRKVWGGTAEKEWV